jgi:hypothetical protein
MAKKRDGKAMAASEKEPSTETAAPLCEGREIFSNAVGSTGNGATGRCAGGEGGVNHPQSGGGNGKIDGGGSNTAIDFTSAFKIGYKGRDGEDLITSALTSLYKKQKETKIQVHSENKSYAALILNESKLTAEQRARLWH